MKITSQDNFSFEIPIVATPPRAFITCEDSVILGNIKFGQDKVIQVIIEGRISQFI